MNTDPQHWPVQIFNWLSSQHFSQLTAAEQTTVLACMSETEYNNLHAAAKAIGQYKTPPKNHTAGSRQFLLEAFDKQHSPADKRRLYHNPGIWQAAAALLLLVCGWMCAQLIQASQFQAPAVALADTVYINQEVKGATVQLHDTIYVYKTRYMRDSAIATTQPALYNGEQQHSFFSNEADRQFLDVTRLDSIYGTPRGNSMKDDSLILRYGVSAL